MLTVILCEVMPVSTVIFVNVVVNRFSIRGRVVDSTSKDGHVKAIALQKF